MSGARPGEGHDAPDAPDEHRPAAGVFRHPITARFGACDPVGIVYFPRYFDWFHQTMEAWFGEALGVDYHVLLRRHGLPAVHTEADYAAPVRFGDRVLVELRLGHLGRSSLRLDYRVVGTDGVLRATGSTTTVLIGTDPSAADHMQPVPIPGPLRSALEHFRDALD